MSSPPRHHNQSISNGTCLDYSTIKGRPSLSAMELVYFVFVGLCYAGAVIGESIMPHHPHREDPSVDRAVFIAHVAAGTSSLLFIWGLVHILRQGFKSMKGLVKAAWIGSVVLPPVVLLFGKCGGPLRYF